MRWQLLRHHRANAGLVGVNERRVIPKLDSDLRRNVLGRRYSAKICKIVFSKNSQNLLQNKVNNRILFQFHYTHSSQNHVLCATTAVNENLLIHHFLARDAYFPTPITQKSHHNTPRRACPVLKVHLTLLPRILCVRTPFAPIIIIITRTCHFTHHTLRALHTHHLSAAVHTHRVQFVSITILVQSNIYEYTWYTQKVGRQEMDCANAISWLEILYNVGRGAFGNAFCLVISCVC